MRLRQIKLIRLISMVLLALVIFTPFLVYVEEGGHHPPNHHLVASKAEFKEARQNMHRTAQRTINESRSVSSNVGPSFSACLLIKDDNRLLWEWLAYHWLVLPLRHLVVAVDPNSQTSPSHIFDSYRSLGMEILELQEDDFFKQKPVHLKNDKSMLGFRQHGFLTHCLRLLKKKNQAWTIIIDSDEFVTFNRLEAPGEEGVPRPCQRKSNDEARNCTFNYYSQLLTHPRSSLPNVGEVTIAKYLSQHASIVNHSCYVMPRSTFVAKESEDDHFSGMIDGLNPKDFTTLRYRYHGPMQNKLPGKSIVHVQRIPDGLKVGNPHRVVDDCQPTTGFVNHFENLLRVHHYVGNADLFLARADSRRTWDVWNGRNSVEIKGKSDALNGWLRLFVKKIGLVKATSLTQRLAQWAFETDKIAYRRKLNPSGGGIICLDVPKNIEKEEEHTKGLKLISQAMQNSSIPVAWVPYSQLSIRWGNIPFSIPTLQRQYLTANDTVILLQGTRCHSDEASVFVWIFRVYRPKVIEADHKKGCKFISASVDVRDWIYNLTGEWTDLVEPSVEMNVSSFIIP